LSEIAFGKANDVVKLAFMSPDEDGGFDNLDLSLLAEVKRAANGAVEVKLVDRLEAAQLLLSELESPVGASARKEAEMFFRALDNAARQENAE
jgi:hypothetical protein